MDGDKAPLAAISEMCIRYNAMLIIDEAHATGVIGKKGEGLVQHLGLADKCFARIHTFGKAIGCHGAVILGSSLLRDYLINFCRPFIYTTALSPAAIRAVADAYSLFSTMISEGNILIILLKYLEKKRKVSTCATVKLPFRA